MSKLPDIHLTPEALWAYIDEASIPSPAQQHLVSCDQCRALLAELQAIHITLKELPLYEPPSQFSKQIVGRLQASRLRFPWFIAVVVSCFAVMSGLSVHLAMQTAIQFEIQISAEFFQFSSLLIIICGFRLLDLVWRAKADKRPKVIS